MERRLGRGLGSLLGRSGAEEGTEGIQQVSVERLQPNPHQPRKTFDSVALEELVDSVRRHGILQPIVVRPAGTEYQIVSGERRWRAAKAAGHLAVPVSVRSDITDDQMLELALVENVQRQDLDAMERAQGFQQMMLALNLSQDQVAEKVGLKRSTVANQLRLLELPPQAQDAIRRGLLSMGHARALLGLSDAHKVLSFVERVVREDLSVRQVEKLVRDSGKYPAKSSVVPHPPVQGQTWVKELEERMLRHLGTKVTLKNGPGYRGQITIEYFNRADLERVSQLLAPRDEI